MNGISRGTLLLLLSLLGGFHTPNKASASDTMYWIMCNCSPTHSGDVLLEISMQVSPHSQEFGDTDGYNIGDAVVVQDASAIAARWKFTAFDSWSDDTSAGFVCTFGFGDCVDLAGGNLPDPPWEFHPVHGAPSQPSQSHAFLNCHQTSCAMWEFEFDALYGGNFRIQSRPTSGGNWTLEANTYSSSYFPHLGQNARSWRIRAENAYGNGPWVTFSTSGQCGSGGGGGGPY